MTDLVGLNVLSQALYNGRKHWGRTESNSTSEEQFDIDFKSSDVDLLEYEGNLEALFEKEIELEVERIHSPGAFLSILVEKLKFWN